MPRFIVGGRVIDFPNSGRDANWSEAVIDFAEAVTDQLASIASQFDISPRVQILTSDTNTNLNVTSAIFPSGSVRSFSFVYAIYRTNGVISLAEEGSVNGVYDSLTSTWILRHQFDGLRQSDGSLYHSFSMSGDQLQFSTVAIGGAYDDSNSKLSYGAKTVLVSDL